MEDNIIRKTEIFIRDVINEGKNCIDWDKLEKEEKTFLTKTRELFKFDDDGGWRFLISCLDTIGDSQKAIKKYLQKEFNKSMEDGENYLRLYGFLSAVYIQQRAIIKLGDLVKLFKLEEIKKDFDELKITFLRHVVSAHPINYQNQNKQTESYRIDRGSVGSLTHLIIITHNNRFFEYNLYDCEKENEKKSVEVLKRVAKKLIENRYLKSSSKAKKLIKELREIG